MNATIHSPHPKIFQHTAGLARAVLAAADTCDVVTFDLFDTLLVRRVAEPDQIKDAVARAIADHAARCGMACDWRAALAKRWTVERRHRHANGLKHPDCEAVYPEFMAGTLSEIFGDRLPANLLAEITDYELRMESAMLVPRAGMLELLRALRARGKTIWIMTDIYLPSTHIRVLVERAGILPMVDGVVSSADECRAKASGAGFDRLRERLGWDPARWLHIGDNLHSDGRRPAAAGIRAFVLRDIGETRRKLLYRLCHAAARRRTFWRGRLWLRTAMPLESELGAATGGNGARHDESRRMPPLPQDGEAARLYRDGYDFFGPLATAFVRHIAEQARARHLRRVYFFSREGRMFLRIWQTAAPYWFPCEDAPEARYLHVSRLALAPATCAQAGLSHANAPMALLPARNRDMRDVCRVFGLDHIPLTGILRKHNLTPETPLNPIYAGWTEAGWHNFELLLHDLEFQDAVRAQTAEHGRRLECYLEQEGFFDHPETGVVDIGWLGTIQRFLFDAIAHRPDCPRLHGFLLAATHGVPYPAGPKNDIEGFLYDRRRHDDAPGRFITNALDIFEEACRAPEPGITGYAETDGKITPVQMRDDAPARRAELAQDAYYAPLQRGMLDFAARGAPAQAVLGYTALELRPWLKYMLARQMAFPSTADIRRLRWRHHLDEYDGRHRPPLRIRLRLTGLWDLPLPLLRWVPGIRALFCAWQAAGLPIARRLYGWVKGR